ncbi:MAG: hypothetical protein J7M19_09695 [Planctomycetes bacterium]|nr:hypothetical protein [Planctomycetota bacterium]
MARFKMRIGGGGSRDPEVFDRLVVAAKKNGFDAIGMAALAEHTQDQIGDGGDSWVRFTAGNSSFMKLVETRLVHDILSKDHIEKNARLLAEQSEIVTKHQMKGTVHFLEPMWLPRWFYEKHPHIRGARCDQPAVATKRYWSPCLDQEEVLAHYREATRKLLEAAPGIGVIRMFTNDSGAGICWCTGLYPGRNGPDYCKDIPFGTRIQKWLKAILDGASDAGRQIEVALMPLHFSRDEKYETLRKLPKHAHLVIRRGNFPNIPFFGPDTVKLIEESKKCRRGIFLSIAPTLGMMQPAVEMPIPYYILDVMREIGGCGAEIISVRGVGEGQYGIDTVPTAAILSGLKRPPKSSADIDRRVAKIAKEQVGAKLAPALVSAWRDVDHAARLWPHNADTNHHLHPTYSVVADRWLVRPLVPVPALLADDERAYYSKHRHHGRGLTPEQLDSFFIAESTQNYETPEFKWLVAIYDEMIAYMNRAVATLETELDGITDEMTKKRFTLQYHRVAAARAIWRTQRNVFRCGSIIEFFTGERKEEYWHGIRKDESYLEPGTYRRLFLEAVDDEIKNCRNIIKMMADSEITLFSTGKEQSFVLPDNLPEQLAKKMSIMEAHKGDIDLLFPNCPPETFTDPTYEWADTTTDDD